MTGPSRSEASGSTPPTEWQGRIEGLQASSQAADLLVSVVVPTRNSAATIGACLESIQRQTHRALEVVVADRDSTDDTVAIAKSFGVTVLTARPERSAQRNAGAKAATGTLIVFIDSDHVLQSDAIDACVKAHKEARGDTAIIIPERGTGGGFLANVRALEKRLYEGNGAMEAARAFPRDHFLRLGGWDTSMTGPEDWDLTDRWKRAGGRLATADSCVLHNDSSLTVRALLRKRFFYGSNFHPYLRKNGLRGLKGRGITRFAAHPVYLLRHPVLSVALLVLKALEAVSFGLGLAAGFVIRPSSVPEFGRISKSISMLPPIPNARILDVGCSTGWLGRAAPPDSTTVGIDRAWTAAQADLPFALADAVALPLQDTAFDVAAMFEVLEHLPRGQEPIALSEIARILRPRGVLLLSTPHRHLIGNLLDPAWILRGHRHYRADEVQRLLEQAGFVETQISKHGRLFEALYIPTFYLFHRLRLRIPFEARWQRAIDGEYASDGWYTLMIQARRPAVGDRTT